MEYESVIGLETHVQLKTRSKMWCGCANQYGSPANTNVCPVCLGMPGVLPVANEEALKLTALTGMLLNCTVSRHARFDRKNYFYPDVPKNYQITQLTHPSTENGRVDFELDGGMSQVRITRAHLEEDVGKSSHFARNSGVDYNRAGVPLLEIVSEPDIRTADMAHAYLSSLIAILTYGKISDCDMEKGMVRCDVNISVRPIGQTELGSKIEIKNMNSMRFIQAAIDVEARRQIAILEDGGSIDQETRLYDPDKNETRTMRSKEEAHDYRYFPCPDLLPLRIEQSWVDAIGETLPELPDGKKARFVTEYGMTEYDAGVLTADITDAAFFEEVAAGRDGKQAANWVINELFGRLNKEDLDISNSPISAAQLGGILDLITKGDISGKIAKDLFEIVWNEGGDPAELVEKRGMKQVTDMGAIEAAVDEIIAANPDQVEKAKLNPKLAGWFVGQVMKATGGKANPKAVNEIIATKLGF